MTTPKTVPAFAKRSLILALFGAALLWLPTLAKAQGLTQDVELRLGVEIGNKENDSNDADLPVGAMLAHLEGARLPGVQQVSLFDLYQGVGIPEGKKSLAFRVLFQDTQRTLTDAEVDQVVQEMRSRLREHFGAQFRGNEG